MAWTHQMSRQGDILLEGWECRGGRFCSDDKRDAFELDSPDIEWEEGQAGHSRGEEGVRTGRDARRMKDWDGQTGREGWEGRRSVEQTLVPKSGSGQHAGRKRGQPHQFWA